MNLSVSETAGIQIAVASGRIDHASSDGFTAALEPLVVLAGKDTPPLLLDLSGVDYISSVGLRALILAHRRVTSQGGRFAVAALQPLVQEVFAIARLNLLIPCYVDVATACQVLAS